MSTQVPRRPLLGLVARGRRQRLPARVAAAPDDQGRQGDEGEPRPDLRRPSFAADFAGAFEGMRRTSAATFVATPRPRSARASTRAATLSYYRSRAKAGLPGARGRAGGAAFRANMTARFDAIAAKCGARDAPQGRPRGRRGVQRRRVAVLQGCGGRRAPVVPRGINDEHVLGHVGMLGALAPKARRTSRRRSARCAPDLVYLNARPKQRDCAYPLRNVIPC